MKNEIQSIISAALQAVNSKVFIPNVLQREQDRLIIAGKTFELKQFKHIYLVAIGKACLIMVQFLPFLFPKSRSDHARNWCISHSFTERNMKRSSYLYGFLLAALPIFFCCEAVTSVSALSNTVLIDSET